MQAGKIYKITNKVNNKIYIGKTIKTLGQRLKEHICTAKRWKYEDDFKIKHPYNSRLYPAMNFYGYENFYIELVEAVDSKIKTLEEAEQYWIKYYNTVNDDIGYNISEGGLGGALFRGHKHTDETKQKLSEFSKAHIKLDEESLKKRKLPCTRKFQNLNTGEVIYATDFATLPHMFKLDKYNFTFCRYQKEYYISLGMRREELSELTKVQRDEYLAELDLREKHLHEKTISSLQKGNANYYKNHLDEFKVACKQTGIKRATEYWETFMEEHNINAAEYKKFYYEYQTSCPNKHLELIFKIGYTQVRGLNKYLGLSGGGSEHKNGKISIEKNN